MKVNKTAKNPIQKISKGYRLKPSTHNMIKKIQIELNATQDKVICSALKIYYLQLKRK